MHGSWLWDDFDVREDLYVYIRDGEGLRSRPEESQVGQDGDIRPGGLNL